ncbi:MAG: glycerate kinase [Magnetovibrio sp.]|nr:glycerate kinase [Magnetovibrio sp.]
MSDTDLLQKMFQAAVFAALPMQCVASHLPERPKGRTIVVGAGKAAAAMAQAVEHEWGGDGLSGLVITRYDHDVPTDFIEVVEASHPVPDHAGQEASQRILDMVWGLTPDDLVLCLISGGGSALMSLPARGVTLEDKQVVTDELLRSGATISEINCVRKHLSAIKGGRLATACYPAQVVSLIISDVPGDDLSVIASGPTVGDNTTLADAKLVFDKYQIEMPINVQRLFETKPPETPSLSDYRLEHVTNTLIATPQMSLEVAANIAKESGYIPLIMSDCLEGEATHMARGHAAIIREIVNDSHIIKCPAVILSGGEATVTLGHTAGRGGPNAEFLLALMIALDGLEGVSALACDTDGIDGSEDNAGARIGPDSLKRAQALGLNPQTYLDHHDAYTFFEAMGDLVITGPTQTNVNDFRAIVVEERPA